MTTATKPHTCHLCGHNALGMEAPGLTRRGTRKPEHWIAEYEWQCADAAACGARLRGGTEPKPFNPDLPFD